MHDAHNAPSMMYVSFHSFYFHCTITITGTFKHTCFSRCFLVLEGMFSSRTMASSSCAISRLDVSLLCCRYSSWVTCWQKLREVFIDRPVELYRIKRKITLCLPICLKNVLTLWVQVYYVNCKIAETSLAGINFNKENHYFLEMKFFCIHLVT